jgi:hypothetical protein
MRPRRTPRQPRPVHLNTIERAIEGARKLPEAAVEALKIALDSTLTEFGQGIDCAPRWCCMADAMNVAEALAQIGICSDDNSKAIIHGGHQVLADVQQRRTAGGSWTLRGNAKRLTRPSGCTAYSSTTAPAVSTNKPCKPCAPAAHKPAPETPPLAPSSSTGRSNEHAHHHHCPAGR